VSIASRRDRLVYFRVTEEEFNEILQVCQQSKARSVSDLARSAIQAFIQSSKNDAAQQFSTAVSTLQSVADDIRKAVDELAETTRATASAAMPNTDEHAGEDSKTRGQGTS